MALLKKVAISRRLGIANSADNIKIAVTLIETVFKNSI